VGGDPLESALARGYALASADDARATAADAFAMNGEKRRHGRRRTRCSSTVLSAIVAPASSTPMLSQVRRMVLWYERLDPGSQVAWRTCIETYHVEVRVFASCVDSHWRRKGEGHRKVGRTPRCRELCWRSLTKLSPEGLSRDQLICD